MLQDRRYPLPERILRMGLALRELADGKTDPAAWLVRAQALKEQTEPVMPHQDENAALVMLISNHYRTVMQIQVVGKDFSDIPQELVCGLGVTRSEHTGQTTFPTEPYQKARARFEEEFRDRDYFMENLMVALLFHLHLPVLSSGEELWKGYVNFCNLYSFYRFMAVMSCREGVSDYKKELFRLMVYASRSLIHNGARQSSLRDELFQNDSATLAHMAILLGG